jgi:hypothetical protein
MTKTASYLIRMIEYKSIVSYALLKKNRIKILFALVCMLLQGASCNRKNGEISTLTGSNSIPQSSDKANGRDKKLKVKISARPAEEVVLKMTRLAESPAMTAKDISPYDEAVSWHHYRVDKVLEGDLRVPPERIRVAHWTVLNGVDLPPLGGLGEQIQGMLRPEMHFLDLEDIASSNELDFDTVEDPGYVDIAPLKVQQQMPRLRWDYGGVFSHRMRLYWFHRDKLRGVVLGNSQAAKAISPQLFPWRLNTDSPAFLNFAYAAAPISLQCKLAEDYVNRLPQIRLVLWVISPRDFNRGWRKAVSKERDFLNSPGYVYDMAHPELFSGDQVTQRGLRIEAVVDRWGWEHRDFVRVPIEPVALNEYISKYVKLPPEANFEFDDEAWELFNESARRLTDSGLRLVLLMSPCHPVFHKLPVSDPDGTLDSAYINFKERLEDFDKQSDLIWFHDFNRDGNNGFAPSDFYDFDHLNASGAKRFTIELIEWIEACSLDKQL